MRPSNVAGTICYYKDSNKPLVQSDIDKLREVNVKDNLMTGVCVCVCVCVWLLFKVVLQGAVPRCNNVAVLFCVFLFLFL